MQSVTGAALAAASPVAAAAATAAGATAPAGLVSAEQAFDEVFRRLTGGLLTTSAGEGLAAAVTNETDGAVAKAAAPDVQDAASAALSGVVVPVPPALPVVPVVALPEAGTPDGVVVDGAGHDRETNDLVRAAAAAGTARAATPSDVTVTAPTGATAPERTFDDAIQTTATAAIGATPEQTSPATAPAAASQNAATTALVTGDDTTSMAPGATATTAPRADTAVEATAGHSAAPTAAAERARDAGTGRVAVDTAAPAAPETPATDVAVDVRGLDGRRGMRETPARARTFAVATDAAPATDVTSGPAAPPAATETASGAALPVATPESAPERTAAAERVFALQRALARHTDGGPRQSTPAATSATAAAVVAALAGVANGQGAGGDTDGETPGRRHGHTWQGAIAAAAAAIVPQAAQVATAGEITTIAESSPVRPGAAAGAAWRAALAASVTAETPAAAGETASAGLRLPVLIAAPAFELPTLRERDPIVIDTPVALPDLDSATGEGVHTQIVKSLRLQWHGGVGEARVTLKPGYLGEVVATVKVEQGVVTATLQADTPEVRRWMENHTATLRDALVDHGLKLDRLTVAEPERQTAQGDKHSRARQQQQEAPRQRARRDTSETDTPFEVITE